MGMDGLIGWLYAKASELRRRLQVPRAPMCRTLSRAQTRWCSLGASPRSATRAKEALRAMWAEPFCFGSLI